MATRLEHVRQIIDNRPTRIVQWRKAHPLQRNEVRDMIYGKGYREIVDQCFSLMSNNKDIYKHPDIEDYDRPEERKRIAKMCMHYHKHRPVSPLQIDNDQHKVTLTAHSAYQFNPSFSVRCDITLFLYTKTLIAFGRRGFQPHENFIRKGLTSEDIGCFGLTQIGHGSDTKNLETEAIYDHSSRNFTLNTPTQTGNKFWIGGASETANMAVIWAQLVINGQKNGVHPFVVPIRDRTTMKTYPGVFIGDCGSKFGNHGIDNGFIGFKNYKIPFDNILDRVSGVDANGNFRAIENNLDKRHGLYMGPLSLGRSFITMNPVGSTFNALNIALKYSCVRRQFEAPNKKEETLIIDYPLIRFRLMPLIAQAFIFYNVGSEIMKKYDHNSKELLKEKSKLVLELHSISAAAKARVSWFCLDTIGQCRHLLGGHGYSSYSRLGRLYFDHDVNTTWEGDNNMLLFQSSKYVLKEMHRCRQKPNPYSILNFVNEDIVLPETWTKQGLLNIQNYKKIYERRLLDFTDEMIRYMLELRQEKMDKIDIVTRTQCYYDKKISFLYNDIFYLTTIEKKIAALPQGPLKEITENCLRLWICTDLERDRWATVEDRKILQEIVGELCEWLTPRSVSLVEACSAPEDLIGSPFADQDGDKMWDKYLALLHSTKDVFSRVPYYQDILDGMSME